MPRLPDRWLNYSKNGSILKNTGFVCFRVPLDNKFFGPSILQHQRWTVQDLLHQYPQLGLVIDLTNTDRYYDPNELSGNGVLYMKIRCPGQQVPPSRCAIKFKQVVDNFRSRNPNKLIGVHCTHGVNRTGYMVCNYLIRTYGLHPRLAIRHFAKSRSYSIERFEYENALHRLSNRLYI